MKKGFKYLLVFKIHTTKINPMKKNHLKEQTKDKLWRELDILINDFGQGTVIVSCGRQEEKQFIERYRIQLSSSRKVIYVDFKEVSNMSDLAEKVFEQCYALFGDYIDEELQTSLDYWREEEDYRFLDKILQIPQVMAEKLQTKVVFWNENFTDVLKLQESSAICNIMRGNFQMQHDVVHIFTSNTIDIANKIFLDYDKPFFRFARIIKLREE